ncbi:MAG: Gmad2 immunoglobulin-like domain-containing protein [Nocardioides sp.]|uniref:Gmad2 immunoglobulin-like domain-containing protein n=1 Tax=Nocardioides sp. TaxID=35761 RepID=UPI0039E256F9
MSPQTRPHRARRTRAATAVALFLLATGALAACGDDSGDTATDTSSSSDSASPVSGSGSPGSSDSSGSDSSGATSSGATGSPSDSTTPQWTTKRKAKDIVLTAPAEGASVTDSFVAAGKANSPEANVPWLIKDTDGHTVLHGHATASGWMDKLYPWRTTIDVSSLSAGTYLFVARTDDPSGGEGNAPGKVSATIVVS